MSRIYHTPPVVCLSQITIKTCWLHPTVHCDNKATHRLLSAPWCTTFHPWHPCLSLCNHTWSMVQIIAMITAAPIQPHYYWVTGGCDLWCWCTALNGCWWVKFLMLCESSNAKDTMWSPWDPHCVGCIFLPWPTPPPGAPQRRSAPVTRGPEHQYCICTLVGALLFTIFHSQRLYTTPYGDLAKYPSVFQKGVHDVCTVTVA